MLLAQEQMTIVTDISENTLGFAENSKSPKPIALVRVAEAAIRIHQQTILHKSIHLVTEFPEPG